MEAVIDRVLPRSSSDQSIQRFTWWPHRGTREWLEWDFGDTRTVSASEVYWFDDTGVGQCRLPRSWRLLYRRDDRWLPVAQLVEFEILPDRFSRVRFDPVETTALRMEVQLSEGYSAGILEWQVN